MHPPRLLATDLDGTFIGDDQSMNSLWEELERHGITVAFSTGRHLRSIRNLYDEKQLSRRAAACLCMVGTEVQLWQDGEYRLQQEWHEIISEAWDKAAVEGILRSMPEARMQPDEWQSPFKSSYFLEDNAEQRLLEIRDRLAERGLQAKVIYSAGRFLDLLPIKSGKGEAVRFLADALGIPPENVITSGDTGNDLDMMRPELGVRSIAVGNSTEELRRFRASHVFHASAHFAAGIREGLEAFGWL